MSNNGFSLFFSHPVDADACAGGDETTGSADTITLVSAVVPIGATSTIGC